MKIGFMQGRLVKPLHAPIQEFPSLEWEKELVLANELNFKVIEWVLDKESITSNPFLINSDNVKNVLKNSDITIGSLSDDYFLQSENTNILSEQMLTHMETVFTKMSELNISIYVLPLLESKSIKKLNISEQIFLLKKIEEIVPKNILVCLESDLDSKNISLIFDSIDSNVFRINYDIGNSAYEGFDFKEEINDYFNLIENVHVKDRTLKGPSVPLGEGDAKVVNVLKELKFRGYNKNLILQAARIPQTDDVELMKQYKKFVENAIL